MPDGVLGAYKSFIEMMVVYNTIVDGVGEGYHKPASIPQGDPFAMMATALFMWPWLMQMRPMDVKPRILADNLQVVSTGPRHLEQIVVAFDKTHAHLEAMGARIATQKSLTFSSNTVARGLLSEHRWRRLA